MLIFDEYRNKYISCILDIINALATGTKFTQEELVNKLTSDTFNEPEDHIVKQLFTNNTESGAAIFKSNQNSCKLTINQAIPIIPSNTELNWLATILNTPNSQLFLTKSLVDKLHHQLTLSKITGHKTADIWLQKNIDTQGDNPEDLNLQNNLQLIFKALQNSQLICYSSVNKQGTVFEKITARPCVLEYSLRNNKYRLLVFLESLKQLQLINVSAITSLQLLTATSTITTSQLTNYRQQAYTNNPPLILEVTDKYNTLERCFSLFAAYDKYAYFDKAKNRHILVVNFYDFEEAEIIRDILSLGSAVIVLQPTSIRTKIIARISAANTLYTT